jgi:hypothetical protein
MKSRASLPRETAEMLAIQALGFLAGEPERLAGFLAATGLTPDRIRAAAKEPAFLAAVLEHILADESLLNAFTDSAGVDPALVAKVQRTLGPPQG